MQGIMLTKVVAVALIALGGASAFSPGAARLLSGASVAGLRTLPTSCLRGVSERRGGVLTLVRCQASGPPLDKEPLDLCEENVQQALEEAKQVRVVARASSFRLGNGPRSGEGGGGRKGAEAPPKHANRGAKVHATGSSTNYLCRNLCVTR